MSVQLRVPDDASERRSAMHPDTRLCLSLVSIGLSAIATLSPAARGVIVAGLDGLVSAGEVTDDAAMDMLLDLRDRTNGEADPETAMSRRIEETLVSTALTLAGAASQSPAQAGTVDSDGLVVTLR
jgi:hypothetical protein